MKTLSSKSIRPRNVPLRLSLVVALVLLVAAGLVASGIAVTSSLERSLVDRVDKSLLDASRGWAEPRNRYLPPPPDVRRPPTDFYVKSVDPDGGVIFEETAGSDIPDIDGLDAPSPVTIGSIDGAGHSVARADRVELAGHDDGGAEPDARRTHGRAARRPPIDHRCSGSRDPCGAHLLHRPSQSAATRRSRGNRRRHRGR